MMNYTTVLKENNLNDVVETKTGHVIVDNVTKDEGKAKVRFLNYGGGFDGWTPQFLMERFEVI